MTDILIYGGLSLLLIGLTFILIASIKGAVYTRGGCNRLISRNLMR